MEHNYITVVLFISLESASKSDEGIQNTLLKAQRANTLGHIGTVGRVLSTGTKCMISQTVTVTSEHNRFLLFPFYTF